MRGTGSDDRHEGRWQHNMGGVGWPGSFGRSRSEESLAATLSSVASLLEDVARVEQETAELLWKLAHTQDEAAIQPLNQGRRRSSRQWPDLHALRRLHAGRDGASGPG
jgi:hypothetical protein